MIRAGAMRHVVSIERRSDELDASGGQLNVWTTFAQRRAAVESTPGREVWAAAQRQGRAPTVFRLRWLDGVLPSMRVRWGDRLFNITSAIDPDNGLKVALVITADELVEEAAA